ncbi:helix-turn-helix domain-containing protein [Nocardioides sp.]|uniref:helix-turn-helix domain-containing protein n=1 Tax=Nocardioides sp. TaxID=35761 RepID=UPI00351DBCDB
MAKAYMSMEEVAEYFGISTRTVRRMMSRQELSANRIGGQWRIPIADVEALEKRTSTKRWR